MAITPCTKRWRSARARKGQDPESVPGPSGEHFWRFRCKGPDLVKVVETDGPYGRAETRALASMVAEFGEDADLTMELLT